MRAAGLLVSVAGLGLGLLPSLAGGLHKIALSATGEEAAAHVASLFTFSFLIWAVLGGIFQFHFGWPIDIARAMRLPVEPHRIYRSRLLHGLVGPWLLLLLPAWLWLAWRQAATLPAFFALLPALILFAMLCNQAAGILSLLRNRLTSGVPWSIGLFCVVALANVTIFSMIRARMLGDQEMLARLGRWTRALPQLPAALPTPGRAMAGLFLAAGVPAPGRMFAWGLLLLLLVLGLAAVEMRLLRRVYWEARPFAADRRRGSWLTPALRALRGRPRAALFAKETATLFENRAARIITFFFASYLPVFALFAPPPNFAMALFFAVLPVVTFSFLKGNMLGSEHPSSKVFFTMPGGAYEALRMKSRAMNATVGLLLAAGTLPMLLAGRPALSGSEWTMLGLHAIALFQIWDLAGLCGSAFFPEPTDLRGVVQGDGMSLGPLLPFLIPQVAPIAFLLLHWGCRRAGHPRLAIAAGAGLVLLLALGRRRLFLPWLRAQLAARQERLYQQLAEPVL